MMHANLHTTNTILAVTLHFTQSKLQLNSICEEEQGFLKHRCEWCEFMSCEWCELAWTFEKLTWKFNLSTCVSN